MLFSESERRELAAFFAKRFSDPTVRAMLAKRAGVREGTPDADPGEAWDSLIILAQRRRKLDKLAQVAAKTDQTDQNLQAVCNLLGARARTTRNRAMSGGLAAAIALGFGLGGWMLGSEDGDIATSTTATETELMIASVPSKTALAPEEPPTTVVEEPIKTELSPREQRKAARALAKANRPPTGPAWRNGRCTYDKPGQFIGYWYAGDSYPGAAGSLVDIGLSVNVRKDYPQGKNGFNKRAPVRCILRRGDKVRLTAAPMEVGSGHYWAPLYHGDLVAEAPEVVAKR